MSHGIQHSVTVHASSVFEAAGLGVKQVREQQMLDDDSSFGEITVEICPRTVVGHQNESEQDRTYYVNRRR